MIGRTTLLAAIATLCAACTTLRPVEAPRDEIQRRILAEELLKPGDKIRVQTTDGTWHDLRVARVDVRAGVISGDDQAVRISDVEALDIRKVSAARTAWLAVGLYLGFQFALGGFPD